MEMAVLHIERMVRAYSPEFARQVREIADQPEALEQAEVVIDQTGQALEADFAQLPRG